MRTSKKAMIGAALLLWSMGATGCFMMKMGPTLMETQGAVYHQDGQSSVAKVTSHRRTITRRPLFASGGKITRISQGKVTVRMWIYSRSSQLTHPKVYYRFLIDRQGKRAESSSFQLLSFRNLTRYYRCAWREKVKIGEVRDSKNRLVSSVYTTRRRVGSCADRYYRRDFRVTFRVPSSLDIRGNQFALRMETFGANYELTWRAGRQPRPDPNEPDRLGPGGLGFRGMGQSKHTTQEQPKRRSPKRRYRRTVGFLDQ